MNAPLEVIVPGSKSLTQRALMLAALAPGESRIRAPLVCDDTLALRAALSQLGAVIEDGVEHGAALWRVRGGLHASDRALTCGDGGTTLRFLAPLVLVLERELAPDGAPLSGAPVAAPTLRLEASAQLARRPHAGLFEALARMHVAVRFVGPSGTLPVELTRASAPPRRVRVDAAQSSQFASALLMAAPLCPEGIELELEGSIVSRPYLELTCAAMRAFGAHVEPLDARTVRVAPGRYRAHDYAVEGDWSAAAFWLAASAITGRAITVPNVHANSLQGDRAMATFMTALRDAGPGGAAGAARRVFDLGACPDLIAPLAVACAFAEVGCDLVGAGHAHHKESDRIAVLARELTRAGLHVRARPDGLAVEPRAFGAPLVAARLDPAGDHRMAMAFGLLSLREPGITVADPACVAKSYPAFWHDLSRVTALLAGAPARAP